MKKNIVYVGLFVLAVFCVRLISPPLISAQNCGQVCYTNVSGGNTTCDLRSQNTCGYYGGVCKCSYAISCGPVLGPGICAQGGGWWGDAPAGANCCGVYVPPPTAPPGGTPPPSGNYGACGSCTTCVGPDPECRTDPNGACVWDSASCGSGSYTPACNWDPNPPGCTGDGINRQYNAGVPTRPACCNGLQENWQGTCVCPWAPPSCTVSFNQASNTTVPSTNKDIGGTFTTSFNNGETISRIQITSSNSSVVSVVMNPANIYNMSQRQWYTTIRGGASGGTASITAIMYVNNSPLCSTVIPVTNTAPGCTLDITTPPNNITFLQGDTWPVQATVTPTGGGVVSSVTFSSSNTSVGTVNPLTDSTGTASGSSFVYDSLLTAVTSGSTTVNAVATLSTGQTCTDSTPPVATVSPARGWWQVIGGNVTSGGSIRSLIPSALPYLIKDPAIGKPGVAIYGTGTSSYDFSAGTSVGQPSSANWLVSSSITTPKYTYDYALGLLPSSWPFNAVNSGSDMNGPGTTASDGYKYYKADSDLTILNTQNINDKVVLFVDGDLTLSNRIRLQNSSAFFMAIVSGDINVDSNLTNNNDPALEGYFLADGSFNTGNSNRRLIVTGSVVAIGGIGLERDLGASNSTTPAEEFRELPRLQLLFPSSLVRDTVVWEEVAP